VADCQDLTNILITCFVWLSNLASCAYGRTEIFKQNVIRLVEATFAIIPLIKKHGLEVAVLESVGEFVFSVTVRFSKFKDRKNELGTSDLFN
jgi:hypothetical protein